MTYTCPDFMDSICDALDATLPDDAPDDAVSELADICLAAIERLKTRAATAEAHLRALLEWEAHTGGREAPCWRKARKYAAIIRKEVA